MTLSSKRIAEWFVNESNTHQYIHVLLVSAVRHQLLMCYNASNTHQYIHVLLVSAVKHQLLMCYNDSLLTQFISVNYLQRYKRFLIAWQTDQLLGLYSDNTEVVLRYKSGPWRTDDVTCHFVHVQFECSYQFDVTVIWWNTKQTQTCQLQHIAEW